MVKDNPVAGIKTGADGTRDVIARTGVKAHSGDVVAVELDATARTLAFRVNGAALPGGGGTIEGIERATYRIAVTLASDGDSVSLVSA